MDSTALPVVSDRPRERLAREGPRALRDGELLALLFGTGRPGCSALELADRLLRQAGSLGALLRPEAGAALLGGSAASGIGPVRLAMLSAVGEIARRVQREQREGPAAPVFDEPSKVAVHFESISAGLEVEKFWVCSLNRRHRLLALEEISSGTATAALVHPREVFRAAIRRGSCAVVCVHNHPSGDPAPSAADVSTTRQLREAARVLDVGLLDHVVVGRKPADPAGVGWFSFRQAGLL